MNFKQIIISIFLVAAILILPQPSFAVTKTSGNIEVTFDEPIFSPSVIWYPGLTYTKSFVVKNIGATLHTVAIQATNTSQTDSIANVYTMEVRESGTLRYGGGSTTMQNFWDAGEVSLSDLSAGASSTYDMTVTMPSSAENDTQNQTAIFDMIIGFLGTGEEVTVLGSSTSSSGGGGSSTPVCNDTAPASAPTILSIVPGTNSAVLNWSAAASPVSYYLIAYGTSSGQYIYGANVGMTTSYTVNNLSGGTTYYFVVQAGNGCALGPFSSELSVIPGGIVVQDIVTGFAPNVLGEATESAKLQQTDSPKNGDIEGKQAEFCSNATWWWMVPLVFGLYSIVLALLEERLPRRVRFVLHAIISMLTAIVLIYAFCIWWYAVLLAIVVSAISFLFIKKR